MYEPPPAAESQATVANLSASMRRDGWLGAPLVADGDQLITGSHRHAAWLDIHGADDDIPTIPLRDVFAEDDLDFDAEWAASGNPVLGDQEFVALLELLSATTREKYGIDLH